MKNGSLFDKYCSTDPDIMEYSHKDTEDLKEEYKYEVLGADVFGSLFPLHEGDEAMVVSYVSEGDGKAQLIFSDPHKNYMVFNLAYMERIVEKAKELISRAEKK